MIQVTTVGGDVLTFETKFEMVVFVKTYVTKHYQLPKAITIDGQSLTIANRMAICEMTYLVKTISGDMYCLDQKGYENFVALVGEGSRKAPVGVSKLINPENFLIGSMHAWTAIFDQDFKNYICRALKALRPVTTEERAEYVDKVLTNMRWTYPERLKELRNK